MEQTVCSPASVIKIGLEKNIGEVVTIEMLMIANTVKQKYKSTHAHFETTKTLFLLIFKHV